MMAVAHMDCRWRHLKDASLSWGNYPRLLNFMFVLRSGKVSGMCSSLHKWVSPLQLVK